MLLSSGGIVAWTTEVRQRPCRVMLFGCRRDGLHLRSIKRPRLDPLRNSTAFSICRCSTTGLKVQGWFADVASANDDQGRETLKCPACAGMRRSIDRQIIGR